MEEEFEELEDKYIAICRQSGCRNENIKVAFTIPSGLSYFTGIFCSPCGTYITDIEPEND
jgi:hypothetical protein